MLFVGKKFQYLPLLIFNSIIKIHDLYFALQLSNFKMLRARFHYSLCSVFNVQCTSKIYKWQMRESIVAKICEYTSTGIKYIDGYNNFSKLTGYTIERTKLDRFQFISRYQSTHLVVLLLFENYSLSFITVNRSLIVAIGLICRSIQQFSILYCILFTSSASRKLSINVIYIFMQNIIFLELDQMIFKFGD